MPKKSRISLSEIIKNYAPLYYQPAAISLDPSYASYPGQLQIRRVLDGKSKVFHIASTQDTKEKKIIIVSDWTLPIDDDLEHSEHRHEVMEMLFELINQGFKVFLWHGYGPGKQMVIDPSDGNTRDNDYPKIRSLTVKAVSRKALLKALAEENIPADAVFNLDYFETRHLCSMIRKGKLTQNKPKCELDIYDLVQPNRKIAHEIIEWLNETEFSINAGHTRHRIDAIDLVEQLQSECKNNICGLTIHRIPDKERFRRVIQPSIRYFHPLGTSLEEALECIEHTNVIKDLTIVYFNFDEDTQSPIRRQVPESLKSLEALTLILEKLRIESIVEVLKVTKKLKILSLAADEISSDHQNSAPIKAPITLPELEKLTLSTTSAGQMRLAELLMQASTPKTSDIALVILKSLTWTPKLQKHYSKVTRIDACGLTPHIMNNILLNARGLEKIDFTKVTNRICSIKDLFKQGATSDANDRLETLKALLPGSIPESAQFPKLKKVIYHKNKKQKTPLTLPVGTLLTIISKSPIAEVFLRSVSLEDEIHDFSLSQLTSDSLKTITKLRLSLVQIRQSTLIKLLDLLRDIKEIDLDKVKVIPEITPSQFRNLTFPNLESITFIQINIPSELLLTLFNNGKKLNQMRLEFIDGLSSVTSENIRQCHFPQLQTFFANKTGMPGDVLSTIISKSPELAVLNLSRSDTSSFELLSSQGNPLTKLTKVYISRCDKLDLNEYLNLMQHDRHARILRFDAFDLNKKVALKCHFDLHFIEILFIDNHKNLAYFLAILLPLLPNLRGIISTLNNPFDETETSPEESLKGIKLEKLERLDLTSIKLSTANILALIHSSKKITYLDVINCPDAATIRFDSLHHQGTLPSLRTFTYTASYYSHTRFSPIGIATLQGLCANFNLLNEISHTKGKMVLDDKWFSQFDRQEDEYDNDILMLDVTFVRVDISKKGICQLDRYLNYIAHCPHLEYLHIDIKCLAFAEFQFALDIKKVDWHKLELVLSKLETLRIEANIFADFLLSYLLKQATKLKILELNLPLGLVPNIDNQFFKSSGVIKFPATSEIVTACGNYFSHQSLADALATDENTSKLTTLMLSGIYDLTRFMPDKNPLNNSLLNKLSFLQITDCTLDFNFLLCLILAAPNLTILSLNKATFINVPAEKDIKHLAEQMARSNVSQLSFSSFNDIEIESLLAISSIFKHLETLTIRCNGNRDRFLLCDKIAKDFQFVLPKLNNLTLSNMGITGNLQLFISKIFPKLTYLTLTGSNIARITPNPLTSQNSTLKSITICNCNIHHITDFLTISPSLNKLSIRDSIMKHDYPELHLCRSIINIKINHFNPNGILSISDVLDFLVTLLQGKTFEVIKISSFFANKPRSHNSFPIIFDDLSFEFLLHVKRVDNSLLKSLRKILSSENNPGLEIFIEEINSNRQTNIVTPNSNPLSSRLLQAGPSQFSPPVIPMLSEDANEASDKKFYPDQIFLPDIFAVSEYRLDVFNAIDITRDSFGALKHNVDPERGTVVAIEQSSSPLRPLFIEKYFVKGSRQYGLAEFEMEILSSWRPLPSLSCHEVMLKLYVSDNIPCEVRFLEKDGLHYIRSRQTMTKPKLVKINFILELREPPPTSFPQEIQDLIAHFRSFPSMPRPLALPPNPTGIDKLTARYEQKIGSCQNRSLVLMIKLKLLAHESISSPFALYDSRIPTNSCHAFIEIFNGRHWYKFDLGGYATELNIKPLPPLTLPPKTPEATDEHTQAEGDTTLTTAVTEQNASPVPISAAQPKPADMKETDLYAGFITWLLTKKQLPTVSIDNLAHIIAPGQNRLIQLNKMDDYLKLIAHFRAHFNKPLFIADTPDDLQWSSFGFKLAEDTSLSIVPKFSAFRNFLTQHPDGILCINWSNFTDTEITALHSLLDTERILEGEELPKQLTILNFQALKAGEEYHEVDFTSRFRSDATYTWQPDSDVDLYVGKRIPQTIDEAKQQNKPTIINLYDSEDWEALMLGRIIIQQNQFNLEESEFVSMLSALHLVNPPWHLRDFQLFWQQALQTGQFQLYGKTFKLPGDFILTFSHQHQLKINCITNELDANAFRYPLNPNTFHEFFSHYDFSQSRFHQAKGLLEKNQGKNLSLSLTSSISVSQWCQLLDEAAKQNVSINLINLTKSELPAELQSSQLTSDNIKTVAIQAGSDLQKLFDTHLAVIVSSTPIDAARGLLSHYPDARFVLLDSTHDFGDLFYKLEPKLQAQGLETQLKISDILEYLCSEKTVIVAGELPQTLLDALSPLLLSGKPEMVINGETRKFTGKLYFISPKPIPFASVSFSLPEHLSQLFDLSTPQAAKPPQTSESPSTSDTAQQRALTNVSKFSLDQHLYYKKQRFQRIQQGFQKSPLIFYSGSTGIGKTTYLLKDFEEEYLKETGKRAKLYKGEAELEAFAAHAQQGGDVVPFLMIDEANLSATRLTYLRGLKSIKPHLLVNGHYYAFERPPCVFLVGNPSTYGGVRQQEDFFKNDTVTVECEKPNHAYLYHAILKPLLSQSVPSNTDPESYCQGMALIILSIQDVVNACYDTMKQPITPRHLHMMAVLFNAYQKQFSGYPVAPAQLVIDACLAIIGQGLTEQAYNQLMRYLELTYQFNRESFLPFQKAYIEAKIQKHRPAGKVDFTFAPSRYPILQLLDAFLSLRYDKQFQFGIALEGDSGTGKSTLIKSYFNLLKVDYLPFSFGSNFESDRDSLTQAAHRGMAILIDEINAGGPKHERWLNAAIMGTDEQGQAFDSEGMLLVSTRNALSMRGRQVLSPALQARFVPLVVTAYTDDELLSILLDAGLNQHYASKWVRLFKQAIDFATTHCLEPKPNLRHLLEAASVDIGKVEEILEESTLVTNVLPAIDVASVIPTTFFAAINEKPISEQKQDCVLELISLLNSSEFNTPDSFTSKFARLFQRAESPLDPLQQLIRNINPEEATAIYDSVFQLMPTVLAHEHQLSDIQFQSLKNVFTRMMVIESKLLSSLPDKPKP